MDDIREMIRDMPPRPPVDRILVTNLAPRGEAWRLVDKRWMLLHPHDWSDMAADVPLSPEVPIGTRLMGIPVEHVVPGSERDREVRKALADAFSVYLAPDPLPSEWDFGGTESTDTGDEG